MTAINTLLTIRFLNQFIEFFLTLKSIYMKRFFKSQLSFWLLCLLMSIMLTSCPAGRAVIKSQPKHYKGFYQQRNEFQKRNDACRREQYRIQGRYQSKQPKKR